MTILFCDNTLWGLLNFRSGVIEHLLEKGYDVILVAPRDPLSRDVEIPRGARYIPIEMSRTGKNPLKELRYYRKLKAIYKAEKPDYIFHYTIKPNIYGTLAAKACKIPSTAMIAGLGHVYTQNGPGNRIARMMYKHALQHAQHVLVLNESNYQTVIDRKVADPSKVIWMKGGEGVDLQKFAPLSKPSSDKFIFLMVGRLLYDKGYTEYVTAARNLSQAEFRIMGPIDDHPNAVSRSTVESDVKKGYITYIEFSTDVKARIQEADCIVLPSYYGEGLSRFLMEGLAMAKPVITTDIPGCREIVENGINGFIVPAKESSALTIACTKVMQMDPERLKHLSKNSRSRAEQIFDMQLVIDLYLQIIERSDEDHH